ncbi:hypothetical protein [Reichenbachiella sp.]|uniref:hypothetical protein n=1 Tax=Reichenbachiella sp. TaxID=2184521 RepID=UPI003BB13710
MEAKETDKLFRDKLKNSPSVPKVDSWGKLEAMLDEKQKAPVFTIWRVAAAVLILLVSGWVAFLWNNESPTEDQVALIEVSSKLIQEKEPVANEMQDEPQLVAELDEPIKEVQRSTVVLKTAEPLERTQPLAKSETDKETEVMETDEILEIEETQLAEAEIETPKTENQATKKKIKSIRITYKRGSRSLPKQEEMIAEQKTDTTSGNKIKEIWEQTREIKPGELWADIRDAKDNLFQKNSKKNNVKNLNK